MFQNVGVFNVPVLRASDAHTLIALMELKFNIRIENCFTMTILLRIRIKELLLHKRSYIVIYNTSTFGCIIVLFITNCNTYNQFLFWYNILNSFLWDFGASKLAWQWIQFLHHIAYILCMWISNAPLDSQNESVLMPVGNSC